jgi:flavin reductase (DIM6/NTAB) family NADH-FMN oxidoreductase RutF
MMKKRSFPLSKVYQLLEPGPVTMVTTSYKGRPNVMTMTWQMMIDFEPPIFACVISDQNFSFNNIKQTKECVINIPTVELAEKVVKVGNTSGKKVDKFLACDLAQEPASQVNAPLLPECYAHLECKVIDMKMAKKYNMFILEVIRAWIRPTKERPRFIHHTGKGVFIVDGEVFKLPSKKK